MGVPILFLGACAMTTESLDNSICDFKILLSSRFPRIEAFWTIFLSAPNSPPPPQNRKFYFYCRLAVSDLWARGDLPGKLAVPERKTSQMNFARSRELAQHPPPHKGFKTRGCLRQCPTSLYEVTFWQCNQKLSPGAPAETRRCELVL